MRKEKEDLTHRSSPLDRGRRTRTLDIQFWRLTFYRLNYTPIYALSMSAQRKVLYHKICKKGKPSEKETSPQARLREYLQNFIQMNCKPRIFSHTFRKRSSRIRDFVASARCLCFANSSIFYESGHLESASSTLLLGAFASQMDSLENRSLQAQALSLLFSYTFQKWSSRIRDFVASARCVCFANSLRKKAFALNASILALLSSFEPFSSLLVKPSID